MDYLRQSKEIMNNILNNFADMKLDSRSRVVALLCPSPISFNAMPQEDHNPEFCVINHIGFISFISIPQ